MTQPAASAVVGATTGHQVVFVGPMGVGKTTAVKALSDIPIVSTDVTRSTLAFSEVPVDGKTTTTVGINYGEWTDPDGVRVGLDGPRARSASPLPADRRHGRRGRGGGRRPAVAEHCEVWSRMIGGMALPGLEKVKQSVP